MWLASPAGTPWDVCLPVTRHDVVYHLLLIHELFADSALKINHALWSIAVEWKIYFLFPLLLAGFRRFGEVTATVLAIAAGYLAWVVCVVFDVMNPGPWGASFYYVGLFTLGMFAAVRSPRPTRVSSDDTSARSDRAWTTALVAASIGVVAVSVRHVVPWQIRSLFVGVWASVLFVALSRDLAPSWLARLLTLRPTVWLGRRGYSIYLVHAPVLELVYRHVVRTWAPSTPWRAPVMVAMSLTATVLVAPPFFKLAEEPFHRLSRTLGTRGETHGRRREIAPRRTGT